MRSLVRLIQRIKPSAKRYHKEIISTVASAALGTVLGQLAHSTGVATGVEQVILALVIATFLLLAITAFSIRRSIIGRIISIEDRLMRAGASVTPTLYDNRKLHFTEEKQRLVEHVVRVQLPTIVRTIVEEKPQNPPPPTVCVVDSGTTLEGVFSRIKLMGLGSGISSEITRDFQIYTNSLSGSDAYCRESGNALTQDQLHLFGGKQMEKYRAVLGPVTIKGLEDLEKDYRQRDGRIIGLVTSNWLLVGEAYDQLVLCSTEPGHLEYKRKLSEIADMLLVVAPLGKLLKLPSTYNLNAFLRLEEEGREPYQGFSIGDYKKRNRGNTLLVTTYRTWTESVLYRHSSDLWTAYDSRKHDLYTMPKRDRDLALDHRRPRQEQIEIEMPHTYLRAHSWQALHIQ